MGERAVPSQVFRLRGGGVCHSSSRERRATGEARMPGKEPQPPRPGGLSGIWDHRPALRSGAVGRVAAPGARQGPISTGDSLGLRLAPRSPRSVAIQRQRSSEELANIAPNTRAQDSKGWELGTSSSAADQHLRY